MKKVLIIVLGVFATVLLVGGVAYASAKSREVAVIEGRGLTKIRVHSFKDKGNRCYVTTVARGFSIEGDATASISCVKES